MQIPPGAGKTRQMSEAGLCLWTGVAEKGHAWPI